jgi:hypothetical protein
MDCRRGRGAKDDEVLRPGGLRARLVEVGPNRGWTDTNSRREAKAVGGSSEQYEDGKK